MSASVQSSLLATTVELEKSVITGCGTASFTPKAVSEGPTARNSTRRCVCPPITNPAITNPDITNGSMTDVTWTVTNNGNTAAAYSTNLFLTSSFVPSGFKLQLVVYKTQDTYDATRLLLVPENLHDGEALIVAVPDIVARIGAVVAIWWSVKLFRRAGPISIADLGAGWTSTEGAGILARGTSVLGGIPGSWGPELDALLPNES